MDGIIARAALPPRSRARVTLQHLGHLFELGRELHQRFSREEIGTLVCEPETIPRALMEHLRIHVVAPWSIR